jgi:flagellar secretion chaperone FliS
MYEAAANTKRYQQVTVETASQGKLIVMLFNGAVQRAEKAIADIEAKRMDNVHNHLVRAQDIIAELRGALNMEAGEIAENLDRIYEYFQHLLIKANVRKDPEPLRDAIELMTVMRDTWQELFAQQNGTATPKQPYNAHGSTLLNAQG